MIPLQLFYLKTMSNTPPTSVKFTGLLLSVLTITLVASQPQKALSEDTSKSEGTIDTVCSSLTAAEKDAVLKVHNDARKKATAELKKELKAAGKSETDEEFKEALVALPAVTWNCNLAKVAQKWADNEKVIKPNPKDGQPLTHSEGSWRKTEYTKLVSGNTAKVGENIAAQWGSPTTDRSAGSFASGWVEEGTRFALMTNTCSKGPCGHYTQVVWRQTTEIGCGVATYDESKTIEGKKWDGKTKVLVCQYLPAGNVNSSTPLLNKH